STWSAITRRGSAIVSWFAALKGKLRKPARQPAAQPQAKAPTRPPAQRATAPPPAEPAPATGPGPAPGAGIAPPAPPPPSQLAKLDLIGDSLTQVVRNFAERATLFGRGQLPCAGLARGLAAVESRWIAYNTARKSAGVLDGAHAARDQRLYAGVDSVERRDRKSVG